MRYNYIRQSSPFIWQAPNEDKRVPCGKSKQQKTRRELFE